jgi:hypothetical protein
MQVKMRRTSAHNDVVGVSTTRGKWAGCRVTSEGPLDVAGGEGVSEALNLDALGNVMRQNHTPNE